MGTKLNPGKFDCYSKLYEDEPYLTLRGKDPAAPFLVEIWRHIRTKTADYTRMIPVLVDNAIEALYQNKITPLPFDSEKSLEASTTAQAMREWRQNRYLPMVEKEKQLRSMLDAVEKGEQRKPFYLNLKYKEGNKGESVEVPKPVEKRTTFREVLHSGMDPDEWRVAVEEKTDEELTEVREGTVNVLALYDEKMAILREGLEYRIEEAEEKLEEARSTLAEHEKRLDKGLEADVNSRQRNEQLGQEVNALALQFSIIRDRINELETRIEFAFEQLDKIRSIEEADEADLPEMTPLTKCEAIVGSIQKMSPPEFEGPTFNEGPFSQDDIRKAAEALCRFVNGLVLEEFAKRDSSSGEKSDG